MSKETTYAGMLGDLAQLTAALAANAAELPHLEGTRLRLAKMLADAQATAQQQAALVASKQAMSKTLKSQVVEGQRMANGLRKLLKEFYGVRSEKLAEFGLQPFRGKKLKPATPEPPATNPPPATTPPSAHPSAAAAAADPIHPDHP
jgi:hypothetical protein